MSKVLICVGAMSTALVGCALLADNMFTPRAAQAAAERCMSLDDAMPEYSRQGVVVRTMVAPMLLGVVVSMPSRC